MSELLNQEQRDAALSATRYAAMAVPERPRLVPWVVAVDLGDGRLQFRSSESAHTLTHPLLVQAFRQIEPLLDGRHTIDAILSSVDATILPTTALFLLKLLTGKSLLQPGADPGAADHAGLAQWERQLDFFSHFVGDAAAAQRQLAAARVGIVGSGALPRATSDALASIGVGELVHSLDAGTDLVVACAESPAFAFFEQVNRVCLANNARWLRVVMLGASAELGPTIVPYQTACYTCFELRRRTHEPELNGYAAYRARVGDGSDRIDGLTIPFCESIAGQAAMEVMRLLTGFAPPVTIGRYYALSAATPLAASHDVLKVPRCPACDVRRSVPEAWDCGFALISVEP